MSFKVDAATATAYDLRNDDFLCSPSMKSAPLGSINIYANASTQILNLPPCPCPECGGKNRMQVIWPYPDKLIYYIEQGIQPIPEEYFKRDRDPLIPSEPNVAFKNGYLVREPGTTETVACWTTCSNWKRIMTNQSKAANARLNGTVYSGLEGVADGAASLDGTITSQLRGSKAFTEEVIIENGRERPIAPNMTLP